ncbi:MAG: hypothetical protein ABII90_10015 [Bacteroidota bacterium]
MKNCHVNYIFTVTIILIILSQCIVSFAHIKNPPDTSTIVQEQTGQANAIGKEPSQTENIDISEQNLNRLWKLQDYYSSQTKKGKIPGTLMESYNTNLEKVEKEIELVKEKRLNYAEKVKITNPTLLEMEIFKFRFRDMDLALSASETPTIYANEIGSWVFNCGITFLPLDKGSLSLERYSVPVTMSAERVFNEKISVGGYAGHFIEKTRAFKMYQDTNYYFSANTENYKHNYFTFGIKGSYHFFNPLRKINIEKFDLYLSAIAGYTLAASTVPFVDNEEYLVAGEGNTEIDKQYNIPQKDGVNYGAFAGIRYWYDQNVGFFLEAGYSNTGFISGGITIRFLGKNFENEIESDIIEFKVQIKTSSKRLKPSSKQLKGMKDVEEHLGKKTFIYVVTGEGTDYASAKKFQAELSKELFKKAVVVAFRDGELISVKKALKKIQKGEE